MFVFKKIFCLCLVVVLALLPCAVLADEVPEQEQERNNIVTEFYSPDLTDPIKVGAAETVAGVGATLEIPAKSYILMEVNTGEILYESESHMKLPPASITKVMALLLVVEAIESGQLTLETMLTASPHACSMGGSQIWLEPNEQMSVHDLLKAAVIGSANDATVVLGEALAGSEEGFVGMMNERAEQLGLSDTTFINCTGLDADGHLTSAHDIAVMSKELIKHDIIKSIPPFGWIRFATVSPSWSTPTSLCGITRAVRGLKRAQPRAQGAVFRQRPSGKALSLWRW